MKFQHWIHAALNFLAAVKQHGNWCHNEHRFWIEFVPSNVPHCSRQGKDRYLSWPSTKREREREMFKIFLTNQPVAPSSKLLYSWRWKRYTKLLLLAQKIIHSVSLSLSLSLSLSMVFCLDTLLFAFDSPFFSTRCFSPGASSQRFTVLALFERGHTTMERKKVEFHLIRKGKHLPRTYLPAIVISPISRLPRGSTVKPVPPIPGAFCLHNVRATPGGLSTRVRYRPGPRISRNPATEINSTSFDSLTIASIDLDWMG